MQTETVKKDHKSHKSEKTKSPKYADMSKSLDESKQKIASEGPKPSKSSTEAPAGTMEGSTVHPVGQGLQPLEPKPTPFAPMIGHFVATPFKIKAQKLNFPEYALTKDQEVEIGNGLDIAIQNYLPDFANKNPKLMQLLAVGASIAIIIAEKEALYSAHQASKKGPQMQDVQNKKEPVTEPAEKTAAEVYAQPLTREESREIPIDFNWGENKKV